MTEGWTINTLKEHIDAMRVADQHALDAAFEAAKEKSESHNRLIEAMERQQATFITKGQMYAALIAAVAVLGLAVTYYANFGS